MGAEVDPYEQQLLAVFDSCDHDHRGTLDRHGLLLLCDKLQLEEQGTQLMECLLDGLTDRVTFIKFRDGLLALLDQGNNEKEGESVEREELPVREVSPKFVFGKKKYGRRTRPKSTDLNSSENQDDSDSDCISNSLNTSKSEQEVGSLFSHNATLPKKRKTSLDVSMNQGRLKADVASSIGMEEVNVPCSVATDRLPTKLFNGEGQVECLRNAWERLGIGSDGYLDRAELSLVCDHIGMEKVAEEVVHEVFNTLDVDCDNRISFEKFLLLFRGGGTAIPSPSISSPEREKSHFEKRLDSSSVERPGVSCPTDNTSDSFFWSQDFNMNGVVSSDMVLEVWEMAGIHDGLALLHNLGFTENKVKISELVEILDNELQSLRADADESMSLAPVEMLLQASLALCQTEVRCVKSSYEQVCSERDKLRLDISEANERASLLAQEVDDHHSRLENSNRAQIKSLELRHAENMKELSERLTSERDQFSHQNQALECRVWELEELDSQARSELLALKEETATLNNENHALAEQLTKLEQEYAVAQKELDAFDCFRQGLSEQEVTSDNEKVIALQNKLEDIQAENTALRDRNDELTMKVESLTSQLAAISMKKPGLQLTEVLQDSGLIEQECSEQGSVMADDLVVQGGAIKRRGDPPDSLSALEESSEDESPRLEKVRRFCSTPEAIETQVMQVCTLTPSGKVVNLILSEDDKLHYLLNGSSSNDNTLDSLSLSNSSLKNLEDSLPVQGDTINQQLEMLTEKLSVREEENRDLRNENVEYRDLLPSPHIADRSSQIHQEYQYNAKETAVSEHENTKEELEQHCRDLKSQLDQVKIEIVKILSERNASSKENCALKDHISDLKTSLGHSLSAEECNNQPTTTKSWNGNVPFLDFTVKSLEFNSSVSKLAEKRESEAECITLLKSQYADKLSIMEANHMQEKIELLERCTDLESSIEMLRQEYEKCEDYWASKLEEERVLFDKEQRILDKKYQKILVKLEEYEEFDNDDHSCNCKRLSTIEEYAMLESQVTAMEAECEDLKKQLECERIERENKNVHMKSPQTVPQSPRSSLHFADAGIQVPEECTASDYVLEPMAAFKIDGESTSFYAAQEELLADIKVLQEKKEQLTQALEEEKNTKSGSGCGKQACHVDLNFLQTMNTRWRQQELRCRHLQAALKQRQDHTDMLIEHNWTLHKKEIADLETILSTTREHLRQQTMAYKEQLDRLARNDLLVKDLYVENAYLVATVQRLEQRCQVLAQMTTDSISV